MTVALLGAGGLASALLAHGSVAASGGKQAPSSGNSRGFNKALVDDLRKRGLQVNPGYPMLSSPEACYKYSYPPLHSCWGNNPVSPYVIPVVKAWSGEQVGPTPANVFGPVRRGYTPLPRLGVRDAVVIYGTMPPPAKYSSVQTWVWSQPGHWKANDYKKWASAPGRAYPIQYMFSTILASDRKAPRTFSISAVGDPLNNVVMQRRSGSPFGKKRYFIITPSATTDRAVRRALRAEGVPGSHIFTEEIPSRDRFGPIGPLGMGKAALDFFTVFKEALPDSQQAAAKWWARLPITVLRVRAPSSLGPVKRYGLLTFGKRTAHSEAYLKGDLRNLVSAVCQRASSDLSLESADCGQSPPASSFIRPWSDLLGLTGPYCRTINAFCGDMSDAGLFGLTPPLPLDSGQVYAVVSTLATETSNAIYVGLAVNDGSTFVAPTGVTDAALNGSADSYASTVHNAGKFYVHYFTRDCSRLHDLLGARLSEDCTSITTTIVPHKGDTSTPGNPALKGTFMPLIRDYIEPGTAHGPDTSKLLTPRILTFTKP